MTPYEIPLSAEPQTFLITLVGVTYRLTIRWCGAANCWVLDIADLQDVPILAGLPLVTGTDLLGPYEYIGIGGRLEVQSLGDINAPPTFDNLGQNGLLFFITEP